MGASGACAAEYKVGNLWRLFETGLHAQLNDGKKRGAVREPMRSVIPGKRATLRPMPDGYETVDVVVEMGEASALAVVAVVHDA